MTNPLVKKGLPQFPKGEGKKEGKKEEVKQEIKEEIKEGTDVKNDVGTGTNNKFENVFTPPVKIKNKQVSIYLDTDVIDALNEFGSEYGKGAKSTLVNNFLKQYFNIRQGEE